MHAPDERSARERVERRARDAETSYLDDRRQTVGRRLKAVVDVREAGHRPHRGRRSVHPPLP
ncbi:hypothetical protein ABT033_02735 [Streptomyces pharetrae]|uniref:hypothetical protein n=1 Tax=Streptomyces pharetrae TaxID=291370 RepID=UPI0033636CE2